LYKIVRRPPCWKSTARLARHVELDWLDKIERVESSRAKWNLSLCVTSKMKLMAHLEAYHNIVYILLLNSQYNKIKFLLFFASHLFLVGWNLTAHSAQFAYITP